MQNDLGPRTRQQGMVVLPLLEAQHLYNII